MILTQEEINFLGETLGHGVWNNDDDFSKGVLWFDANPTELIRAAEKLILEKLDAAKNL